MHYITQNDLQIVWTFKNILNFQKHIWSLLKYILNIQVQIDFKTDTDIVTGVGAITLHLSKLF